MFEKLSVKNFKSWASCDLEFGKVTALFGANSSGKTSLLQLLLLLKQTIDSRDRRILNLGGTIQDFVDFGSYEDIVHGRNRAHDVVLGLRWRDTTTTLFWPDELGGQTDELEYEHDCSVESVFGLVDDQIKIKRAHYHYTPDESEPPNLIPDENDGNTYRETDSVTDLSLSLEGSDGYEITSALPSSVKLRVREVEIDGPSIYRREGQASTYIDELKAAIRRLSNSIFYLGPLRAHPQREYRWTGERPSSVGSRGEYAVQTILANLTSRSRSGDVAGHLVDRVNTWLQRLGLVESIELKPIAPNSRQYEFMVRTPGYSHPANLADVGLGVSQGMPIIVLSYFVPPGAMIVLEQPEIHLHPQVQAELADLFLEVARERNIQFLIESHSEHLLNRLQRRVAEREGEFAKLTETDVRLYFCRRVADASVLEPVRTDALGNIENIPSEFYDPILPFIESLNTDNSGDRTDLSERHDYYIGKELSRELRDKDGESE